jgi:hypothetical protein
MSQKLRVNIQYAVDFDDIPQEVIRLLDTAKDTLSLRSLTPINNIIREIEEEKNIHNIIQKIDDVREYLAKADYRLSDCIGILSAYQKTLSDLNNPQEETSQEESNE